MEEQLNNIRRRKLGNSYLVTTDHGSWASLEKEDFDLLMKGRLKKPELIKELKEKGFILTKKNMNNVVEKLSKRFSFLLQGTSLHIVVPTLRCNLKCVYCHASSRPLDENDCDMDINTAEKVVDFIFQSPSKQIAIELQGGEPLLRFDIVKRIIEYANEKNKRQGKDLLITIVTNLTQMDEEKMRYLLEKNVGICTSLDGPKELHESNRKGSHGSVVKWVKRINEELGKQGKKARANALLTITRKSLPLWKEIIDEYVALGLGEIHLRFLNNLGDARPVWSSISYSADEFIEFWKKSLDYIIGLNKKKKSRGKDVIVERMAKVIMKKILGEYDPNYLDMRSPCGASIGQLVYNHNGDIFTCDEGRMIGGELFRLGNVKKNTYHEIISSDQTCSMIAASCNDTQICDYCAYKPYCGICPVCNYAEQGSIIAKIPQTARCKIFKAQFDYIFDKLLNDKEARKILEGWAKR